MATARLDRVPQRRTDRSRRDGRCRLPGGALPLVAPAGALRGDEPLGRVRRQPVPAEGSPRRRLPPRPHARGDVHPARQRLVRLLQGPAALHLPDPDQVPRRGPPACGSAARARVRDEGLLQLRCRRRGPAALVRPPSRGVHHHLRAAGATRRDRLRDVGCDGRLRERGVPDTTRCRRGHLRALYGVRLRGQYRSGQRPRTRPGPTRRNPRGASRRHTGHADHPDARRSSERPSRVRQVRWHRLDGGRHDEERRRQVEAPGRRRPKRSRSACPAIAMST